MSVVKIYLEPTLDDVIYSSKLLVKLVQKSGQYFMSHFFYFKLLNYVACFCHFKLSMRV